MNCVKFLALAMLILACVLPSDTTCRLKLRGVCVDRCVNSKGRFRGWAGCRNKKKPSTTRRPPAPPKPQIKTFKYDTDSSGNVKFEIDHSQDKSISIREYFTSKVNMTQHAATHHADAFGIIDLLGYITQTYYFYLFSNNLISKDSRLSKK